MNPTTERSPILRDPNFRWLIGGGALSMLGDQFTLIALPWLVLRLTGSTLALGLVLAVMSVPRAIFILIGGALVDRHSPKRVLMLTKYANTLLLGALAALELTHQATLPLLYALALAIGLSSAFSIPSGSAILPHVVAPAQLQQANGVLMGMRQAIMLAGPLLASLLFALAGDSDGTGYAFAIDAASFLLSAFTLARVRTAPHAAPASPEPIGRAIGAALCMAWNDKALRTCLAYWAACTLVVGGALQVGLPVIAQTRLGGAAAFGMLMGAHGAGTLAGMALSGIKGRLRVRNLGTTLLLIDMLVGALLIPMGYIGALWQGALLMLTVGLMAGFMQVAVFSWMQQRVPRPMLGRAMSIFMFIFMGVAPLSAAAAGWALQFVGLSTLLAAGGAALVLLAVLAFLFTPMRSMSDTAVAPH